jgi:hypothetical protein
MDCMRLEALYRIRFTYPEGWDIKLEGGWEAELENPTPNP